jgi:hypothetical protein
MVYRVMWFDMPEYYRGNCNTVAIFKTAEEAFKCLDEVSSKNHNDNMFFLVVVVREE